MNNRKFLMGVLTVVVIVLIFRILFVVSDNTAELKGQYLYWNNSVYKETSGAYQEGKTIARTTDKKWSINEVKDDKTHTFVVLRSFLDQYLYVKEDYKIPQNGKISSVYINYNTKVDSNDFCNQIHKIIHDNGETFTFETDNIYSYAKPIYLCFDNCPVGTHFSGFVGVVNNKWVYIPTLPTDTRNEDGSPKAYKVNCKIINDEKSLLEIKKYIKYSTQ